MSRSKAAGAIAASVIFSILSSTPAEAGVLNGILHNNQGVRAQAGKKTLEAYNKFNSALVDLPYSPEVHYNLGNSFLENKEYDKALSEYRLTLKLTKEQSAHERALRFYALFNSAVAMTQQKKTDEALNFYQAALEYNPKSIETKTNIELLAQQGGGQGEGDSKDKQPDKDGKGEQKPKPDQDKKDQKPEPKPEDQQKKDKPKPKPFQSKELNQQDVNRILEELKRQEDSIREKMQKEGPKDAPLDKDW